MSIGSWLGRRDRGLKRRAVCAHGRHVNRFEYFKNRVFGRAGKRIAKKSPGGNPIQALGLQHMEGQDAKRLGSSHEVRSRLNVYARCHEFAF